MKKIKLYARTDMVGSKVETIVEVDEDDWASMDDREKKEFMLDELFDRGMVEWGYEETEQ